MTVGAGKRLAFSPSASPCRPRTRGCRDRGKLLSPLFPSLNYQDQRVSVRDELGKTEKVFLFNRNSEDQRVSVRVELGKREKVFLFNRNSERNRKYNR
jgi:hypothetical protein